MRIVVVTCLIFFYDVDIVRYKFGTCVTTYEASIGGDHRVRTIRSKWANQSNLELLEIWKGTDPDKRGHKYRLYQAWLKLHPEHAKIKPKSLKQHGQRWLEKVGQLKQKEGRHLSGEQRVDIKGKRNGTLPKQQEVDHAEGEQSESRIIWTPKNQFDHKNIPRKVRDSFSVLRGDRSLIMYKRGKNSRVYQSQIEGQENRTEGEGLETGGNQSENRMIWTPKIQFNHKSVPRRVRDSVSRADHSLITNKREENSRVHQLRISGQEDYIEEEESETDEKKWKSRINSRAKIQFDHKNIPRRVRDSFPVLKGDHSLIKYKRKEDSRVHQSQIQGQEDRVEEEKLEIDENRSENRMIWTPKIQFDYKSVPRRVRDSFSLLKGDHSLITNKREKKSRVHRSQIQGQDQEPGQIDHYSSKNENQSSQGHQEPGQVDHYHDGSVEQLSQTDQELQRVDQKTYEQMSKQPSKLLGNNDEHTSHGNLKNNSPGYLYLSNSHQEDSYWDTDYDKLRYFLDIPNENL